MMSVFGQLKLGALAGVCLVACGAPAEADLRSYSAVLEEDGLAGVSAWATSQPHAPETSYLLGMSEALSAIEHVLQIRYATYSGELPLTPGGRAAIAYNREAVFDPAFVETAMLGALDHFVKAENALEEAVGKDFAVDVDLEDLWFDIDSNGERDEGEDAVDQLGFLIGARRGDNIQIAENTVIRFDTADADWLAAYVHLASASAELVLSVDPTSAIAAVFEGNEELRQRGIEPGSSFGMRNEIDTFAVILTALDGSPDTMRTRAALAHFKAMISHNQSFWDRVVLETDDDKEWLPNANQTSAFGVVVTEETAANWQAVLAEMSDVFNGEKLIPHWRFEGQNVGIDIESLLNDPGDFDLVLMLHGASLAPYMEQGDLVDMRVWRDFSRSVGGRGTLFALWMN